MKNLSSRENRRLLRKFLRRLRCYRAKDNFTSPCTFEATPTHLSTAPPIHPPVVGGETLECGAVPIHPPVVEGKKDLAVPNMNKSKKCNAVPIRPPVIKGKKLKCDAVQIHSPRVEGEKFKCKAIPIHSPTKQ